MHDRIPRTLSLSLTCLNRPTDTTIAQTIFAVQFISGSFPHLGETPGCLIWHLPQVFFCHYLSTDHVLSLQIQSDEQLWVLLQRLQSVGGDLCSVNWFCSWAWPFHKMSPKQQNPPRKPKPPVPTPYRRPKPFASWPSGIQTPGEPPRLAHFNDHMLSPSSTWKSKLLRRRAWVSLTSSLPVKPPYKPALWNSAASW